MIERIPEIAHNIATFQVSGTVIADDVEEAVYGDPTLRDAPADGFRLAFIVDRDFDGYWAEFLRGLRRLKRDADCASRIRKIVIVTPPTMREQSGIDFAEASPIGSRVLTTSRLSRAKQWIAE